MLKNFSDRWVCESIIPHESIYSGSLWLIGSSMSLVSTKAFDYQIQAEWQKLFVSL